MTPDVLRRMLWKEYRALRGFWLAVVGIVAFCLTMLFFVSDGVVHGTAFFAISGGAVVLYALGAAATVFAIEREDETITFLQVLPVRGRQVLTAKVGLAAASVVAMAVALLALAAAFTWLSASLAPQAAAPWLQFQRVDWTATLAAGGGTVLVIFHVFAWGLFFSLILRRPLVAACLAAVAALAAAPVAMWLGFHFLFWTTHARDIAELIGVILMPAVLLIVDLWLGTRWLEGLSLHNLLSRRRQQRAGRAFLWTTDLPVTRPARFVAFYSLAWQELRQAWPSLLVLAGASIILAVLTNWYPEHVNARVQHALLALPVFSALIAVAGAFVFRADQEGVRFRFFAERPVGPRSVWWNRQLVWLSIIAVWLALLVPFWFAVVFGSLVPLTWRSLVLMFTDGRLDGTVRGVEQSVVSAAHWDRGVYGVPAYMTFGIFALSAYACGQLCSLLFRSGIIAGFLAVTVTLLVMAWLSLTGMLGVWFMIAAVPIPLWLLWASWLRAPDWIGERRGWRPAVRLAASLVLPALAIAGATIAYRVLQVPAVVPQIHSLASTPAAEQTADMYRRAADLLASSEWPAGLVHAKQSSDYFAKIDSPDESADVDNWLERLRWLDDNAEALKLAIAATAQPGCALPMAVMPDDRLLQRVSSLAWLIETDARRLAREGRLEEALQRELANLRLSVHLRAGQFVTHFGDELEGRTLRLLREWWPALPGQTSEQLRRAIVALETWQKTFPGPEQEIEARYRWWEKLLALDPQTMREAQRFDPYYMDEKLFARHVRLIPWELARAKRMLNYATEQDLLHAQSVVEGVKAWSSMSQRVHHRPWYSPALHMLSTTGWLGTFQNTRYQYPAQSWIRGLAEYRTTQLCLAIAAWQLDHQRPLTTLSDIVGEYLPEIPRDPYWGNPYLYYPAGVDRDLVVSFPRNETIAAGTPFIWGAGPMMYQLGTYDSSMQHHEFYTLKGKRLRLDTEEYELLATGWAVPIEYGPASEPAPQPEADAARREENAETPPPDAPPLQNIAPPPPP